MPARARDAVALEQPLPVDLSYEKFTLDNGLSVLVHEDHAVPIASVNLWYRVGSANERPGHTGFAHLFEHLMFEGSANVPQGEFDNLLEAAGGINNGSTNADRTNYWETVPSNALELAMWLEADRMGWLLATMTQGKLDQQRGVVKNERRQSYENRPYGLAWETVLAELYPPAHPYHWPTIGSMADLDAATLDDVRAFFRTYYAPNNAILALAGDVTVARVRELATLHFGDIPRGPAVPPIQAPPARMESDRRRLLEDDVTLPRLYMAWHSPPYFSDGDAALDVAGDVLADGKSSRLYRTLVYERQVAQDVSAFQNSGRLGSSFWVVVTARPDTDLDQMETAVREAIEDLAQEGPSEREVERSVNGIETSFVDALQTVGGFGGKADQLNMYEFHVGDPGYAQRDLQRFTTQSTQTVRDAVRMHLAGTQAVVLSVVPEGRAELAAGECTGVRRDARPAPAPEGGADALRGGQPVTAASAAGGAAAMGAPDGVTPSQRNKVPQSGPIPELRLPTVDRFTLSNGLQVVLVEQHELPVVDLRVVVRTGAAADTPIRAGRMTLLADMLDEGTASRSALEIADQLDHLGAELRLNASWDASVLDLHVLRPRLEPALDLAADVLLNPAFPQEELERKRDERIARLIQQQDEPGFLANNAFLGVLYGPDHPFGTSSLGTRSSVAGLGRDALVAAYQSHYRPDNAFLVVVGDVERPELEGLLERALGSWQPGAAPDLALPDAPAAGPTTIYIVDRPAAAQSEVRIGHIGVARDTPDYFPLLVMNTVLGGSFTSRLNMNLRQAHGWTYGAGSTFDQRRLPGPFVASAAVDSAATHSAVVEFVKEMCRMREEPVPAEELERARSYVAYGLARRFETTSDIALRLADAELYGLDADYYDRYVANVRAVSAADVARVAREYLDPQHWAIVIAGDRTQIEDDLRALGLGNVIVYESGGDAL